MGIAREVSGHTVGLGTARAGREAVGRRVFYGVRRDRPKRRRSTACVRGLPSGNRSTSDDGPTAVPAGLGRRSSGGTPAARWRLGGHGDKTAQPRGPPSVRTARAVKVRRRSERSENQPLPPAQTSGPAFPPPASARRPTGARGRLRPKRPRTIAGQSAPVVSAAVASADPESPDEGKSPHAHRSAAAGEAVPGRRRGP